jgi:drug/metabolite transporter (DMT)-like permease
VSRQDESLRQSAGVEENSDSKSAMSDFLKRQPVWILLAVASGACAAFNGVFAKLYVLATLGGRYSSDKALNSATTALTSTLSANIANLLLHSPDNKPIELIIRAAFFGLNILFNIAMWALFTAALTRGSSTTRVSIVNVSSNFFITAILGLALFGEKLPPMWWVGAGLLASGNVVIGRREEGGTPGGKLSSDETREEARDLLLGEELVDRVKPTYNTAGGSKEEL